MAEEIDTVILTVDSKWQEGLDFRHSCDAISVSGQSFNPATLMQISTNWMNYARKHGWVLRNSAGHKLALDSFIKNIHETMTGVNDDK